MAASTDARERGNEPLEGIALDCARPPVKRSGAQRWRMRQELPCRRRTARARIRPGRPATGRAPARRCGPVAREAPGAGASLTTSPTSWGWGVEGGNAGVMRWSRGASLTPARSARRMGRALQAERKPLSPACLGRTGRFGSRCSAVPPPGPPGHFVNPGLRPANGTLHHLVATLLAEGRPMIAPGLSGGARVNSGISRLVAKSWSGQL